MYWWISGTILSLVAILLLWKKFTIYKLKRKEIKYYEAMNRYIELMGHYESILELQGTDEEYCIACMKMQKAGYLNNQSEKVVGALTMDSAKQYRHNRELALLFLKNVEKRFFGQTENSKKPNQ